MDLDFDDFDGPKPEPTRKFQPKNSKFKPKPKDKPKAESLVSEPALQEFDSNIFIGKDEIDAKPLIDTKLPLVDSFAATTKSEYEQLRVSAEENSAVKMDIEDTVETEEPMEDVMEEDNFEDYVVREIDVYFSPPVDPDAELYVLQYPLRPRWRPYEIDERCEEVRVKSKTREVEMDLKVEVESKNYDSYASDAVTMAMQVLSSSWKPIGTTGHVVGVLVGNELHLNQIHSVAQLRPSFKHLQSKSSQKKNVADEAENKPGTSTDQSKEIEEPWIPLKYIDARSNISARYGRKMVAQSANEVPFSLNSHEYISALCPTTSNHATISNGPSKRELLLLPLEDRIKTLLLEGSPVHKFNALKHIAPESDSDVLSVLQKFAHVIQGLWVPKSGLIYAKEQSKEILARDYILLLFSKSSVISNTQLPQKPELLKYMKEVLKILAVERPSLADWKFKEPCDVSFIKLHQDLVKEQQQSWDRKETQITNIVFGKASRPSIKNPPKADVDSKNTSNTVMQKTSSKASSMPDAIRKALPKALRRVFQAQQVCSFEQVCARLRDLAISESNLAKGGAKDLIEAAGGVNYREELLEIIKQDAIDIHGVFVSKSPNDGIRDRDPFLIDYRRIVIDLLRAEKNAKLKKAALIEAAKIQLNREPTNSEFLKVMNELCTSQGSAWVLKSGDWNPK
jgi:DNA-directed RNA polymerase-3 subunit RPC5